ncbi:hypothetical protein Q0Z83_031290 [Actinoplanes sichuanensis]|nr:hypothetical protein Q0Z83_031290 [Actinoplanes sichuanensis]
MCVGTTNVPAGPNTSNNANTTDCTCPATNPTDRNAECTSTTSPAASPNRRRSAANELTVCGTA